MVKGCVGGGRGTHTHTHTQTRCGRHTSTPHTPLGALPAVRLRRRRGAPQPRRVAVARALMSGARTVAVDAMGGDFGPRITVPASIEFLKNNPDCAIILSDYRMPGLSGVDFLKQSRLTHPTSGGLFCLGKWIWNT